MSERMPAEVFPPGEFIREELEARGWTQEVLADVLGTSLRLVNEVITGKRAVTPETARALGEAFDTGPAIWLNLESTYRLSLLRNRASKVAERAKLYSCYPVRDMVRRGWIEASADVDVLEKRVCKFLGVPSIEERPPIGLAALTSLRGEDWTPAQIVWATRAKQLAHGLKVSGYSERKLDKALEQLRPLLHAPEEAGHVPKILAEAGVRLVVNEPIPNTRIDGACLWLDEDSPVVALSLRYDRLSAFWHPLLHELDHVKHREGDIVEELPDGSETFDQDASEREARANAFASQFMIPDSAMNDFITREEPLFSMVDIVDFAGKMRVHPWLVVSQLHHRGVWPHSHGHRLMARVRSIVTGSALTDGWGSTPRRRSS